MLWLLLLQLFSFGVELQARVNDLVAPSLFKPRSVPKARGVDLSRFKGTTLYKREEEEVCVDGPAYYVCSNADFCCAIGDICQPNNHWLTPEGGCCPEIGNQCDGTNCCQAGDLCCSTSPTGCCADFAYCCQDACCIGKPVVMDYVDIMRPRRKNPSQADIDERTEAVKELFKSMCKGMKASVFPLLYQQNFESSLHRRYGKGDTVVFEYLEDEADQNLQRGIACSDANVATCPALGLTCDEFPFASVVEGGAGAIFTCIPSLGNSIQGGILGALRRRAGVVNNGDHFEFSLSGVNCDDLLAGKLRRRDDASNSTSSNITVPTVTGSLSSASTFLFDPFDGTSNITADGVVYLGALKGQGYRVDIRIDNGTAANASIIDYQGQDLNPPTAFIPGHVMTLYPLLNYPTFVSVYVQGASDDLQLSVAINDPTTAPPNLSGTLSATGAHVTASPKAGAGGDDSTTTTTTKPGGSAILEVGWLRSVLAIMVLLSVLLL